MNIDRVEPITRYVREFFDDLWFDGTRNIRTAGNVTLQAAGVRPDQHRDSELYQPARPGHIRQALSELPADDLSTYTFVDLGSGKGRTLFVAAEFCFRAIIGVEFSAQLHQQARLNARRFRSMRAACRRIVARHLDAQDFVFPDGRLVLYMFNPFGRETMQVVLDHLADSLARHPRHVIVVLLWPRCEDMVAALPGMRLVRKVKEYQIFHNG